MKTYEITVVVDPDLSEDARKKALGKVKDLVEKEKGMVEKAEDSGKKELAYPIKGKTYGYYSFFKAQLPENKVADVDKSLRLTNEFIRYLLVVGEE